MHELSHLDTWGLKAGMEPRTNDATPDFPSYEYHGTLDYDDDDTPEMARHLTDRKKYIFPTYWNAESYAAFALGTSENGTA